jgi:hypothetical protein
MENVNATDALSAHQWPQCPNNSFDFRKFRHVFKGWLEQAAGSTYVF